MNIYLAGGFHGRDWQSEVEGISNFTSSTPVTFENPRNRTRGTDNGNEEIFKEARVYTQWDLQAIRKSQIVFVYIAKENPGLGSLVEVGYAKGLGKIVILVVEPRGEDRETKDRYFDFAREVSDVYFDKLEDGVEYLKSIL